MITHPHSDHSQQDTAEVRAFFEQWAIYRKIVDLDYLNHHGAYAAIEGALAGIGRPFSFLDLGAGDADRTSRVLAGKSVTRYEAVDLSVTALGLAHEHIAKLGCPATFTPGDFFQLVKKMEQPADVVFIGLSLHHLVAEDKRKFLPELRRIVAPGGRLIVYEPTREPGESRDEVLARWWRHVESAWTELTPEELSKAKEHVFGNDYPEPIDDYVGMMRAAGFTKAGVLYTDPQSLYAVIEADA
ncbi:MAG: class I SAM-dependent methyltransferase [Chthoniobacterales bacterium]